MSGKLPGKLIVVSGPSGVGKTSVCKGLLEREGFQRVITATSRPPRPGEKEGVDYIFLTRAAFEAALTRGEFLESAEVHGNLYGTPLQGIREKLEEGEWLLLNIDVQGARQIREASRRDPSLPLETVFLLPPSMEELGRRLRERQTDDPREVENRLKIARKEMEESRLYDHTLENGELVNTVENILEAIGRPPRSSSGEKT